MPAVTVTPMPSTASLTYCTQAQNNTYLPPAYRKAHPKCRWNAFLDKHWLASIMMLKTFVLNSKSSKAAW